MHGDNYRLIVPREYVLLARESKPPEVDELTFKSKEFADTVIFAMTTIAPHVEWIISLYWQLKDKDNSPSRVRLVRNKDGDEAEFENMSAEDIERIIIAWRNEE